MERTRFADWMNKLTSGELAKVAPDICMGEVLGKVDKVRPEYNTDLKNAQFSRFFRASEFREKINLHAWGSLVKWHFKMRGTRGYQDVDKEDVLEDLAKCYLANFNETRSDSDILLIFRNLSERAKYWMTHDEAEILKAK